MDILIKNFTILALKHKDTPVIDLFNYYLAQLKTEEAESIGELFHLFIRAAETAREADPRMQELILKI